MKSIDRLLKKASNMVTTSMLPLFPCNGDCFLDALGVDPEKYGKQMPDGSVGYDFLAVLYDIAGEAWAEYDE